MLKTGLSSVTCQAVWEVSKTNPGKQPWEPWRSFLYFPWQPSWELSCLSSSILALSPVSVAQGCFGSALALRAVQERALAEMLKDEGPAPGSAAEQPDKVMPLSEPLFAALRRWDMELLPVLAAGAEHSSPRGPVVTARIPQSHCNANNRGHRNPPAKPSSV